MSLQTIINLEINQEFKSVKTGNILKVVDLTSKRVMIENSGGEYGPQDREIFERAIKDGHYVGTNKGLTYKIKVLPRTDGLKNKADRKRVLICKETGEVSPKIFGTKRYAEKAKERLNSGENRGYFTWYAMSFKDGGHTKH